MLRWRSNAAIHNARVAASIFPFFHVACRSLFLRAAFASGTLLFRYTARRRALLLGALYGRTFIFARRTRVRGVTAMPRGARRTRYLNYYSVAAAYITRAARAVR